MSEALVVTSLVLNVVAILSFIYHLAITHFKIRLMWTDYARRHGINGGTPQTFYAVGSRAGEEALRGVAEKGRGASA